MNDTAASVTERRPSSNPPCDGPVGLLRRAFTCFMGDRWGMIRRGLAARRNDPPDVGDIYIVDGEKPRLVLLTEAPHAPHRSWRAMEIYSADANVRGGLLVTEPEPCAGIVIHPETFAVDSASLKLRTGWITTTTIQEAILRESS